MPLLYSYFAAMSLLRIFFSIRYIDKLFFDFEYVDTMHLWIHEMLSMPWVEIIKH